MHTRAISKRLGHMLCRHSVLTRKIGNRPRHAQHPVKRARREVQPLAGGGEEQPSRRLESAMRFQPAPRCARVARRLAAVAHALPVARELDLRADAARICAARRVREARQCDWRHRDMQVDAVGERTGQSTAIFRNVRRGTDARLRDIAGMAARAGV